ncbi:hypothetical protein HMPREF0992_01967, partial [Lachnospiraceae bacterium 6_1_63FAA]
QKLVADAAEKISSGFSGNYNKHWDKYGNALITSVTQRNPYVHQ